MKLANPNSNTQALRLPQRQTRMNAGQAATGAISEKDLKLTLRNVGLKVTDQRMLILKELYGSSSRHVTAQQVYESVSEVDPSIGFATVYRLLRNLTDAGIMTETRMGGISARYELSSREHHDHLTCENCGVICEFENPQIEKLQSEVAAQFGFSLTHHVLELFGICPACRGSQTSSKKK